MAVGVSIGRLEVDLVSFLSVRSFNVCERGIALHRIVLYASTVVYLVHDEISIVMNVV